MSFLSLLTYESPFLIFLSAPFLVKRKSSRQILTHGLIVSLLLLLYICLRMLAGEARVAGLSSTPPAQGFIFQVLVGPLIASGTYMQRPFAVLQDLSLSNAMILFASVLIFFVVINLSIFKSQTVAAGSARAGLNLKSLAVVALVMTLLAYPSALMLPVSLIDGRASRVHFSAVIGLSLFMACAWSFLLVRARGHSFLKKLTIFALSTQMSLLFIFCIDIQKAYRLSWRMQQEFWSDVVRLAPDIEENTVILVKAPSLVTAGKQINPFDWSVPSVLSSIYYFPKNWSHPPRLYILKPDVLSPEDLSKMISNRNKFLVNNTIGTLRYYYEWGPEREVDPRDVILLIEEDKALVRRESLSIPGGNSLKLKNLKSINSSLASKPSLLFSRLVSPDGGPLPARRKASYLDG